MPTMSRQSIGQSGHIVTQVTGPTTRANSPYELYYYGDARIPSPDGLSELYNIPGWYLSK